MNARPPRGAAIAALCVLLLTAAVVWPRPGEAAQPMTALLLTARADLPDANFHDAVVLVLNNLGPAPAGVIVNRPTRIDVAHLFPDVERLARRHDKVYFGGPVQLAAVSFLFRASAPPKDAVHVVDDVYLATDRELLRSLLERGAPTDGLRIVIGYAGWAPGQLEAEIARGDWTVAPARADAIFGTGREHAWPDPTPPNGARRI